MAILYQLPASLSPWLDLRGLTMLKKANLLIKFNNIIIKPGFFEEYILYCYNIIINLITKILKQASLTQETNQSLLIHVKVKSNK